MNTKELPVLPLPAEETWRNNARFFIYTADQLQAYGDARAAHAREMALSEAVAECLRKHANGNHMNDTRYECAGAIEALKGK